MLGMGRSGATTKDKVREDTKHQAWGFIKVRREDLEEYSESKCYNITSRPLLEE